MTSEAAATAVTGTPGNGAPRAATVRAGLAALAKSVLLLGGVPATLVRLWLLASPPGRPWTSPGALATHAVLAAVAGGWVFAGVALVRDVVGALARRPLDPSSWSRRWALRLVALLLMLGAGAASSATGRARPVPGAMSPAATAPSPSGPAATALASVVAAAGVGALVGAAIAGRARLLRRASAALRRPGERQARPSPRSAQLELFLGSLGGDGLVAWVDAASRLLWRSLRAAPAGTPFPQVDLVRAGPDGIELRLALAAPDPLEGFQALDGGRWWCLDPSLSLDDVVARTDGCGRLLPGLIPVGEDGTAAYLVNVAPGRRLALAGDEVRAGRALEGIVLALRCLPWADELATELVGIGPPGPAERCYHLSASSPEELAALAEAPAYEADRRCNDRWARQPLVVSALAGEPAHSALLERCRDRAGIVGLGGDGDDQLVLDGAGALLEPAGLRLRPLCPTPAQLAEADRLLAEAAASARPVEGGHVEGGTGTLAAGGRVEVRLLDGEPRLEGGAVEAVAERDRARAVEVLVDLALRGGEASVDELLDDLFLTPRRPDAGAQLERILSAARAALGVGADGTALLRRPRPDRVELHPEVTLDASRLGAAAATAMSPATPPAVAERLLRDALALVGPRPLGPVYPWLASSGRRDEVAAAVVDAAHHLALLALATGDVVLARWAVTQGRLAEPCAEVLARDLMLACDADGDHDGTVAAWRTLEDDLARLGGHEPSEETRELYVSLARRRR